MTWVQPSLQPADFGIAQSGTAKGLDECYKKFIEPHLPNRESVRHWHRLLMEYADQPSSVLFIRRGSKQERRGFLTQDLTTGFGYVFCDNAFAKVVYEQVIAGGLPLPALQDFQKAVEARTLPVRDSRHVKGVEATGAAFKQKVVLSLKNLGLKLSHLHPAGGDYSFSHREVALALFPFGDDDEWNAATGIRPFATLPTSSQRNQMVAYFLRAVHPANFFLSPAVSRQVNGGDFYRHDVGEYKPMIAYIRQRLRVRYGADVMDEFEARIFLQPDPPTPASATTPEFILEVSEKGAKRTTTPTSIQGAKKQRRASLNCVLSFSTPTNSKAEEKEFVVELLKKRVAYVTLSYADKPDSEPIEWHATKFKADSYLRGNLLSTYRREQREVEKITAIHVSVRP